MSTIPTTFNGFIPSYTVVGGTERGAATGLSAVILNRGGRRPRYSFFEDLEKAGFDYVISVESPSTRYDLESLSQSFPFVRFILLKEPLTAGEEINLAAAELNSPLFFVLRNDLRILRSGGADRMAERLLAGGVPGEETPQNKSRYKRLCTVPQIQDGRSENMPTLVVPAVVSGGTMKRSIEKNLMSVTKTIPLVPEREGLHSLYPFDGIGIYDRERFVRLGGFDASIGNFHWQLMDFGFRSCLWGEEIASTQLIKLSYEGPIPPEDTTLGESFFVFYLKNLAPVFKGDYAHIPLRRFPGYFKKRGDLLAAWEEFIAARNWVKTNRYRFVSDARAIAGRFVSTGDGGADAGGFAADGSINADETGRKNQADDV